MPSVMQTIERDPRVGGLHDRVGGERRRHEDHRSRRRPSPPRASRTVSKIGRPWVLRPPLPGVTPPTIFVP